MVIFLLIDRHILFFSPRATYLGAIKSVLGKRKIKKNVLITFIYGMSVDVGNYSFFNKKQNGSLVLIMLRSYTFYATLYFLVPRYFTKGYSSFWNLNKYRLLQ